MNDFKTQNILYKFRYEERSLHRNEQISHSYSMDLFGDKSNT